MPQELLVVRGAGNDAVEAEKAIGWMRMVLFNTDWRPDNLARHERPLEAQAKRP